MSDIRTEDLSSLYLVAGRERYRTLRDTPTARIGTRTGSVNSSDIDEVSCALKTVSLQFKQGKGRL